MRTLASCPACQRLEKTRAGSDPFFICELRQSYVLLHKHQPYLGWCSLFVKEHHEHLSGLDHAAQAELWQDVMQVADTITKAFSPRRLNYENLGNVVPHVHWHIIPRYESPTDPDPKSTIWTRSEYELNCGVSDEDRSQMIFKLRHVGLSGVQ